LLISAFEMYHLTLFFYFLLFTLRRRKLARITVFFSKIKINKIFQPEMSGFLTGKVGSAKIAHWSPAFAGAGCTQTPRPAGKFFSILAYFFDFFYIFA